MAPLIPVAIELARRFAPAILQYVTGSDAAGNVAAKVVDIASIVTGGAPDPVAAMMADPAMAIEFQKEVMRQEAGIVTAYLADVQDARAMQVAALSQDDKFSKRFVYYFAAGWSLFAMLYFAAVTFWPPPADGVRVADTILGVLISTVLGSMIAYFYGSTAGGKAKSALLALAGK